MRTRREPETVQRSQPGFGIDQWIRLFGGSASVTATSVQGIDVALQNSVVWRCATKNAATLGTFPVHTHRGREVVASPRVVADPSPGDMLQSVWVFAAFLSMYLRGGAYGWVGRDVDAAMGRPGSVPLIHPDRVNWTASKGWTLDDEPVDPWPLGPLWHCPLYVLPGSPKGLNPLQYARRSLFPGMAAQEFGAGFFRDGGHPTAIVSVDGDPAPTVEQAQQVKDRLMEVTAGRREPLVVPANVKWTQLQVSPEDSQFIELMRLSDEQVCRYMGTPPEEIGIAPGGGNGMTYANREQRKQDYLQELLLPMRRLEEAWSQLIAPPSAVKLKPEGLLRADIKTRYESYEIADRIGLLTNDEMRELEDRPPLPPEVEQASGRDIAELIQKIYLGVDVVVSAEEAREIANRAGAGLSGPLKKEGAPSGADPAG